MRKTTRIAIVTGALALSAVAVPAAQADSAVGDTKITKISVNAGKDIVVGTTEKKTVTISVTATDDSGIKRATAMLWHGSDFDAENGIDGSAVPSADWGSCTVVDATTSTCKITVVVDPKKNIYGNILAGKWKVWALAQGNDADKVQKNEAGSAYVKRASRLSTNASPEPVKKGKTITVTGALTRANWDTSKYAGYTSQSVKLQYKKKGASSYTTLKTVKSGSAGALKTTVTASADGYFRYSFAGTSTTPTVTATSDFVDVR